VNYRVELITQGTGLGVDIGTGASWNSKFAVDTGSSELFSVDETGVITIDNDVTLSVPSSTILALGAGSKFRISSTGQLEFDTDVNLKRGGANILQTDDEFKAKNFTVDPTTLSEGEALSISDNYILFDNIASGSAEPSNPSGGRAKLYVKTNGSGKEELRIRFDSGAFRTIATEP
jgi:hypothetical protein